MENIQKFTVASEARAHGARRRRPQTPYLRSSERSHVAFDIESSCWSPRRLSGNAEYNFELSKE
jgi:hypothetical protein